jgi:hypothetical protein
LFVPVTGQYEEFGLSHVRGLVGALMQITSEFFDKDPTTWSELFNVRVIDETPLMEDRDQLARQYELVQKECDVIFGPMSSWDAEELFIRRKLVLDIPAILTTASTPLIRSHAQYGEKLFQLSPNIDNYCSQLIRYCAEFMKPLPDQFFCLFRDDEYGANANRQLAKYITGYNLRVRSSSYPMQGASQSGGDYKASVLAKLGSEINEIRTASGSSVVAIVDVGDTLKWLIEAIRKVNPQVRIVTPTSLDRELIESGSFENTYFLYSFAPVLFSVVTLDFYRYMNLAQADVSLPLDQKTRPVHWQRIETVDAEVHDATIYWFSHMAKDRMPQSKNVADGKFYVTSFVLTGNGSTFGNVGQLYIFKVEHNQMVPVEVTLE